MKDYDLIRFIIAASIGLLILAFSYYKSSGKKHEYSAKFLVRSAIFAAFSIILYLVPVFNLKLPIFPFFLSIHFDEIPVFIAGFAYGPLSAMFILIVKTLVKLPLSSTLCVGELADLIYSTAFVIPAALIYKKHRNIKGAIIALGISTVIQLLVSCFVTTFLILDFYIAVMGWPESQILAACQAVNPAITDLRWPFFFFVALPFNGLKDVLVVIATFLLYKRLHILIDKIAKE